MYYLEWLHLAPVFLNSRVARSATRDLLLADQP